MKVFQFRNMVNFMGVAVKIVSLLFNSVGTEQISCDPKQFQGRETASEIAREPDMSDAGALVHNNDCTTEIHHSTAALLNQNIHGLR